MAPKHQPGTQPQAVLCPAVKSLPTKTLVPSHTCDLDAIFRNMVTCQGQTLTWLQRCLCFVTSFCICSLQRPNHTGQDAREWVDSKSECWTPSCNTLSSPDKALCTLFSWGCWRAAPC